MALTAAECWLDLAALLDPANGLAPPLDRPEADWRALYQFSTAHLVTPTLYAVLAARGTWAALPEPLRDALELLHQLNAERNARLRQILRDTAQALNAAGFVPLALKGAIALLPGGYPHAEARMLGDLDLALPPAAIPPAIAALRAAGYTPPPDLPAYAWVDQRHHHHAPPLLHPAGAGYVELHRALLSPRVPPGALPLEQVTAAAREVVWEGVHLQVPSLAHRLLHNSLHHQVQDGAWADDRRSLRSLLEFAQWRGLPAARELDWPALLAGLDAVGVGDAVRVDLLATQHLFGQPLPAGVRPTPVALAIEGRFWWRQAHPLLSWGLDRRLRLVQFTRRLPNLPRRLLTPGWLPAKLKALRRRRVS